MKYKLKVKHEDGTIQENVILDLEANVSIGDELISIHGTSYILEFEIIQNNKGDKNEN